MNSQDDDSRREPTAEECALVARFWSRFYSESLRIFGDKKGPTFAEMMRRAMRELRMVCEQCALHPEDFDNEKPMTSFNWEAMKASCDEISRKRWSGKYNAAAVVTTYYNLINPVPPEFGGERSPMKRRDAVEECRRRFKFISWESCFKYLKSHGVKGLPPNWEKGK